MTNWSCRDGAGSCTPQQYGQDHNKRQADANRSMSPPRRPVTRWMQDNALGQMIADRYPRSKALKTALHIPVLSCHKISHYLLVHKEIAMFLFGGRRNISILAKEHIADYQKVELAVLLIFGFYKKLKINGVFCQVSNNQFNCDFKSVRPRNRHKLLVFNCLHQILSNFSGG